MEKKIHLIFYLKIILWKKQKNVISLIMIYLFKNANGYNNSNNNLKKYQ